MEKISKWLKKQMTAIALATANVEKNALGQESIDLGNNTDAHQRHNQGTLADSLVQGEITEEVKNLRWRMFKVLDASNKMIVSSLGVDEEGYHTLDIEQPDSVGSKVLLSKVKIDDFDDYPLELVIDNKEIAIGSMDAVNEDLKEYNYDERKASVEADEDGDAKATIGEITNEAYHATIKGEKPVKVIRELRPKFEIERFTKKLNVRKINDKERLLEFYVSIYPDEYDKRSKLFLSELKRAMKNPRVINMLDITAVGFTTYKAIGVKDFHEYQYKITGFDKIVEFNGHYIIKFKSEVIVNGEYLLEKYRLSELDKKYENKERKD
jgi:hypothetical protein